MKVWIYVEDAQSVSHRICWYMGTSDVQIENAVRMQLRLPLQTPFLVRDADGDVVPMSSTLPHDQYYTLVLEEHLSGGGGVAHSAPTTDVGSLANAPALKRTMAQSDGNGHDIAAIGETANRSTSNIAQDNTSIPTTAAPAAAVLIPDSALVPVDLQQQQQHHPKRRKVTSRSTIQDDAMNGNNSNGAATPVPRRPGDAPSSTQNGTATTTTPPTRARSIANIVTQFLETFTRPILNDDNVNFIPNTGKYALYALYSEIIQDPSFHPKGQDAFYKMTSMQGKVDRQRVIRYYQDMLHTGHVEYVQYKPQGKGPFLRRYCMVESEKGMHELIKKATFVTLMDLVPEQVVAKYLHFVKGFHPISKTVYQAHQNGDECFLPGT